MTAGKVTNIATATAPRRARSIRQPRPAWPVETPTAPTGGRLQRRCRERGHTNGNTVLGDAGDVITYTFSVSNTGTVDLTNVVSDACWPGAHDRQLPVARPMSPACCNNTYVITAADVAPAR
ncbi:hypothetical protein [Luteimonas mephitis]|uniref:DUF7507 domain-containing protein n=1 Tax=Luteimonas mephitis TaxID=83615 RepID=UPI003A8FD7B0